MKEALKLKYKPINYILGEVIKVDKYIDKINRNRKKQIEFALSGETTINLLDCSTLVFDRVLIDIVDEKSDKRLGVALTNKMKKDNFLNVRVDKVQNNNTIFKNTLLIRSFGGKIRIPTYEKLLVDLDTYGLLLDEEYRVFKKISEKINISKLNEIVKFNKINKLHISNYAKQVLSNNIKNKDRTKTISEKDLIKKVLNILNSNENTILYGGEAVNKQVGNNSRVTFDIDTIVNSKEIKKITTSLKSNNLTIKDKYSDSDSDFVITKTPNGLDKTTICVLNKDIGEKKVTKKTLIIDLIHRDVIMKELLKKPIKSEKEQPMKMMSREALICVKLDTIYRNIKKNNKRGWDRRIAKDVLDILLLDDTGEIKLTTLKNAYKKLNKIEFISIDWSKTKLLETIIKESQSFEKNLNAWVDNGDMNPNFKYDVFEKINKYIEFLSKPIKIKREKSVTIG